MKAKHVRSLFFGTLSLLCLVLHQNCSPANFSGGGASSAGKAGVASTDGASPSSSPTPAPKKHDGSDDADDSHDDGEKIACDVNSGDVQLSVDQVVAISDKGEEVSLKPVTPVLHSADIKSGIKVVFSKDMTVTEIRLVLKSDGNVLVDSSGSSQPLMTPSAQESGFKIHLDGKINVKAGQIYTIGGLELSEILQQAGPHCMLHPECEHGSLH